MLYALIELADGDTCRARMMRSLKLPSIYNYDPWSKYCSRNRNKEKDWIEQRIHDHPISSKLETSLCWPTARSARHVFDPLRIIFEVAAYSATTAQ